MSSQVKSRPRKSSGLVLSCLVLTSSALAFEFCSREGTEEELGARRNAEPVGFSFHHALGPRNHLA